MAGKILQDGKAKAETAAATVGELKAQYPVLKLKFKEAKASWQVKEDAKTEMDAAFAQMDVTFDEKMAVLDSIAVQRKDLMAQQLANENLYDAARAEVLSVSRSAKDLKMVYTTNEGERVRAAMLMDTAGEEANKIGAAIVLAQEEDKTAAVDAANAGGQAGMIGTAVEMRKAAEAAAEAAAVAKEQREKQHKKQLDAFEKRAKSAQSRQSEAEKIHAQDNEALLKFLSGRVPLSAAGKEN